MHRDGGTKQQKQQQQQQQHEDDAEDQLPTREDRGAAAKAPACPDKGQTRIEEFELNGTTWVACEDLQQPGGALVLLSSAGDAEWFPKTYEPYGAVRPADPLAPSASWAAGRYGIGV